MSVAKTPIPPAREPSGARKADHLRIAAGAGVVHGRGTGLDAVRLRHRALPGRDLDDVTLEVELLGARLAAPVFVSAMTGGTREARVINDRLARAAAEHGIAMTLGSGRALLDDPSLLRTYRSRDRPPLLLANLGAVQLAARDGVQRALALVDLLEADGLSVHLNPVQEAVQPEGETAFGGVAEAIAGVAARLAPLPVVVKEVGFGMDVADVALLADAGMAAVDVAGAGGTNWALVEGRRDPAAGAVAAAFGDWGVGTRRRPARPRWSPRPGCRSSPAAACATASRRPSAWPSARPRPASPGRCCRPRRTTAPARRWRRCCASCASRRGPPGRRRRPRSDQGTWPGEAWREGRRRRRRPRRPGRGAAAAGHGPRRRGRGGPRAPRWPRLPAARRAGSRGTRGPRW